MQADFPVSWHTAFQDIISLLADGAGTADMFCRILTSVDEDIISLEIPRSAHSTIPPSPSSFPKCNTRGVASYYYSVQLDDCACCYNRFVDIMLYPVECDLVSVAF